MIDYLDWDSQFFGMKIGRYEADVLTVDILNKLLTEKEVHRYQLVYLFVKQVSKDVLCFLEKAGISPVDNKVTYGREFSDGVDFPPKISSYQGDLTPELLQLALDSGHKSRFKQDKRLAPYYDALYSLWIEKSLSGQMADVVFVYKDQDIRGFVTLKSNGGVGKIGLIAVKNALQGQGIGAALMDAALHWCHANQLNACEVVTQMDNIGACGLYEKKGYQVLRTELVYHL